VDADATVLISMVDLSADEIVESLLLRWVTLPTGSGEEQNFGLYRFQVPGIGACTQLAETYSSKTFSAESTLSKAMAMRQAKFNPVKFEFAGVQITSSGDDESCWISDLLDTVARESFSVLRYAVPAAAGLVCSEMGGRRAGALCQVGAEKAVSSLRSYLTVEADGHPPPQKDDIKRARVALHVAPKVQTIRRQGPIPRKVKKPKVKRAKAGGAKPKTKPGKKKGARKSGGGKTQVPKSQNRTYQ